MKSTSKELHNDVSAKVCNGELMIEKMKSSNLEDIMKDYSLWEEYQNQMHEKKNS
jgi:hypothetical protein